MRPCLLGLACFLVACFSIDSSRIVIICDETHACPDSQVCVGGRCASASSDMATPDGMGSASDMMSGGCAAGINGKPAGAGAWACPGTFGLGQARSLCAPGVSICKTSSKVDLQACNALAGFFAADAPGWWSVGLDQTSCAPDPSMTNRVWFGCGGRTARVYTATSACQGFTKFLDCQAVTTKWDCSGGVTLDATTNGNLSDGVLCCP